MKFHSKHYSANMMRVCIYGKESLDELQVMAESCFNDVKNQDLSGPHEVAPDPFGPDQLGRLIQLYI